MLIMEALRVQGLDRVNQLVRENYHKMINLRGRH